MSGQLELDELVEQFTLLPDEVALLRNKSGATRLGFAVMLKYFTRAGRFPSGRSAVTDEAVEFVARQIKAHRAEIRQVLGFRECGVADAEKLTDWLVAQVADRAARAGSV